MADVRLQRFLSQAGVAARRKAELLIVDGRVAVNGVVVRELGTKVNPSSDEVAVDGVRVERDDPFYLVLNKPKGCVTTVSDPEGRPTVMDYVFGVPSSVVPVGRLDFYSEGVLLMTNDGALSAALLGPSRHVEKTYHVKIRGRLSPAHLRALRRGVRLDDGRTTRSAEVDILPNTKSSHDWLVITLTEGRSRQIHRMLEALGYQVTKLQRVAFAGITYEGLRIGDARELSQAEVDALYQQVGLKRPPGARSRGRWQVRREQTENARRTRGRAQPNTGETAPSAKPRPARGGASKPRPARGGASKPRPAKPRPARDGASTTRPARDSAAKPRPARDGASKPRPARGGASTTRPARDGASKPRPARGGASKPRPAKPRPAKGGASTTRPARGGASKPRPSKPRPAKGGASKPRPAKARPAKPRPAKGRPKRDRRR